jgi:hypothetical protein
MPNDHRHYVPILKGRLGEFTALSNTASDVLDRFTPLLEVVPGAVEFDDDGDPTPESVTADVTRFIDRAVAKWANRPMIVDASLLPGSPGARPPIVELIEGCRRRGQPVVPVVRPSDSDDLIGGVRDAAGGGTLAITPSSACIRLAGEDLDDTNVPLAEAINRVLGVLAMRPDEIDLVLDFGAVSDEQAAGFAARIARLTLGELPYVDDWHTLALAAGAFPTDLNAVQPNVLSAITRYDAGIWRGVRGRVTGRVPSFADYAIAHPVMPATAGFAPAPQLRYTVSQEWLVMKGRKTDRRGAQQFFDICRAVANHPEFTPDLSWGDRRIAMTTERDDDSLAQDPGTGNAMTWRAIGTSHHIAFVVNRLATRDEP